MTEPVKAWPVASAAWGGMFRAFGSRPVIFLVAAALYAAIGVAVAGHGPLREWFFHWAPDQTKWANGGIYVAARMGMAVVTSLVIAPLLLAVHRVLLQDRVQTGWGAALRKLFGWLLSLQLFATVLLTFSMLASAVAVVRGMIDVIAQIAILIMAWRLALVSPAVAIGVPASSAEARIDASWTAMDGRFWMFVRVLLMTLLPMLVLMIVLNRAGLPKPPNPPPISPPTPAPTPVTMKLLITQGLLGVVQVITIALAASAASQLYARLMPRKS